MNDKFYSKTSSGLEETSSSLFLNVWYNVLESPPTYHPSQPRLISLARQRDKSTVESGSWWNAGFRKKLCGDFWSAVVGIEVCGEDGYAIIAEGGGAGEISGEGRGTDDDRGTTRAMERTRESSYTNGPVRLDAAAMVRMHQRLQDDVLVLFTERFDESARLLDVMLYHAQKPIQSDSSVDFPISEDAKARTKLEVLTQERYRCFNENDHNRPARSVKVGLWEGVLVGAGALREARTYPRTLYTNQILHDNINSGERGS